MKKKFKKRWNQKAFFILFFIIFLVVTSNCLGESIEVIKGDLRQKLSTAYFGFWKPVNNPLETGVYNWEDFESQPILRMDLSKIPENSTMNLFREFSQEEIDLIKTASKVILSITYTYNRPSNCNAYWPVLIFRADSADWKKSVKFGEIRLVNTDGEWKTSKFTWDTLQIPEWVTRMRISLGSSKHDASLSLMDISFQVEVFQTIIFPNGKILKEGGEKWFELQNASYYTGCTCMLVLKNEDNRIIALKKWIVSENNIPLIEFPTIPGIYFLQWVVLDKNGQENLISEERFYVYQKNFNFKGGPLCKE